MEVGAVKQAFNSEVIHLKKKLNQAKIHVIHKLTRKAKTLMEKKSPEHLKEKLKKKAESAVNEVLIIKKIKAKDIAKFIITHTGEVKDYLNRPKVDIDKACARLVLHKAIQDRYQFIRNIYGNVPIKDLFMSRIERRKLKKEARDLQKNKKKGKEGKVVNSAGDWDVEDVKMGDSNKAVTLEGSDDDNGHSDMEMFENSGDVNDSDEENDLGSRGEENEHSDEGNIDEEAINDVENDASAEEDSDSDPGEAEVGKYIKLKPIQETKQQVKNSKSLKNKNHAILNESEDKSEGNPFKFDNSNNIKTSIKEKRQVDKKVKENKNKNLKEKLLNRNFKKDDDNTEILGKKVVDPFFITATGENYMSLAEPRKPDEVKEVHKQGNRQERRAVMFGHVAKFKPRRDNFRQNNFNSNEDRNGYDKRNLGNFRNKNDRFNSSSDFNDKNAKFDDRRIFNNNKLNERNNKFNSNINDSKNFEKKEEKLHPSWEAKRKLKASMTLKPAHGKKIVFDDN